MAIVDLNVNLKMPAKHCAVLDRKNGKRYRVLYGGRGSGKSFAAADIMLIDALENGGMTLCARQFQASMRDSVHRLLIERAESIGVHRFFEWGKDYFRTKSGDDFVFVGLHNNIQSIKSLQGAKRCWVEEAETITENSWKVLTPTLREAGSYFVVVFNPDSADDPTYKRFVLNPPEDCISAKVNFCDNPFFPEVLEKERQELMRNDPEAYAHIWLGECRSHSDAQIFRGKWRVADIPDQMPEDAAGPYYGADWGFAKDPTALVRCYVHAGRIYITHEAFQTGCEIDSLPALFDNIPGVRQHTIRADSARPETISYMARQGFNIIPCEKGKGSVESGISWLRKHEEIIIHPRCRNIMDEFRLYSYKIDRLSGDVLPSIVDKWNHGIDALRYAFQPLMRNDDRIFIGRA